MDSSKVDILPEIEQGDIGAKKEVEMIRDLNWISKRVKTSGG